MTEYYTYVHLRASNNTPFYYGKGKGRRAWEYENRNVWWHRVENKHGRLVVILSKSLTNQEAIAEEIKLIAEARINGENIVNMTPGGEGVGGIGSKIGGRKAGEKCVRLKLGIHAPGMASKGGYTAYINGVGIFNGDARSRGGRTNFEMKVGCFSPEIIGKPGKRQAENKTGMFSKESLSNAGKISALNRYKCSECEKISTAAGLANHQKHTTHKGVTKL